MIAGVLLLIFIAIVGQALNLEPEYTAEGTSQQTFDNFSSSLWLNETESEMAVQGGVLQIGITLEEGVLYSVLGMCIFLGVIGLQAATVGLDSVSVAYIFKLTLFSLIWAILSAISFEHFCRLPAQLGQLIFFIVTILYGFDAFKELKT